jgi:cell wall-associated NlpC family hydrolase
VRRHRLGVAGALCCLAATWPASVGAQQGIEGRVGRFYQDDGWTVYRLGVSRPLIGPIGSSIHGDYLRRVRDADGALAGVGLDLTAFQGAGGGPYLVAGIGAGMGSAHSQSFSSTWSSWSAGLGYELVPASFVRVGAEGRWREISLNRRTGFEFAAGLSFNLGGGSHRPRDRDEGDGRGAGRASPAADASGSSRSTAGGTGGLADRPGDGTAGAGAGAAVDAAPGSGARPGGGASGARGSARVADSVVETATSVMGRPYEYGGTGAGGGGFDCSGLIQYAYGRHGVSLPRTSAEQAREGRSVKKNPARLLPGDLLTFSNRGGQVTHVGLYIGGGRFIHSATRGVQISALSPDDPYGRWWYTRWVGVRRILE